MQTFDYTTSKVIFRDQLTDFKNANVSIASSLVLYGLAVYTVFNVRYIKKSNSLYIFRLQDHYKRLCNSAKIMGFADFAKTTSYEAFVQKMTHILTVNNIKEDVLVRASLFIDELIAGTKVNGLKTSFSAYIYPMGQFYSSDGVNVCVSSWVRTPDNAIPSRAKVNGSYANATLMKNEALLNGYDEAIALDNNGHVTEGTVANIFLVRGGELITPDHSSDILEGITRDTVITLAKQNNLTVHKRTIDRSELYIADEIFYCGSSARIAHVASVDKRQINGGKIGPVTNKIADLYEQAQTKAKDSDWITVVSY